MNEVPLWLEFLRTQPFDEAVAGKFIRFNEKLFQEFCTKIVEMERLHVKSWCKFLISENIPR